MIVTSEAEKYFDATRKATGYDGEVIVDIKNLLIHDLKNKGLVGIAISDKSGYEYGMAQPALLVQKEIEDVIEMWAIEPSMVSDFSMLMEESEISLQKQEMKSKAEK